MGLACQLEVPGKSDMIETGKVQLRVMSYELSVMSELKTIYSQRLTFNYFSADKLVDCRIQVKTKCIKSNLKFYLTGKLSPSTL